ncbi:MAG: TylF/MycF/NovP-related O-methyltransferase [Acidobacteriota bacterium]|nr:TylF/MycF/NovP-related O-methyltransferase [Acidobacteriota bacterium]
MDVSERYLALLRRSLTFTLWPEPLCPIEHLNEDRPLLKRAAVWLMASTARQFGYQFARDPKPAWDDRRDGCTWPYYADTMMGLTRLEHLQHCVETVLREAIPGDLIETGVWRGGRCILMRGVLAAHGITDRTVYVADSFRGFPPVEEPQDIGDTPDEFRSYLAIDLETVRENFRRYGSLDEQVVFLDGWFKDTLTKAPVEQLAILRLDGDMYSSTMDALKALYPKLASGGFCIVDDYGAIKACRQAVDDFRAANTITAAIETFDWTGVFWRKV